MIEVNQSRALKGGVTPGDTAGFSVTISEAGSYRLTSNLTVSTDVEAVSITSNDVTLDLNGFSLIGPETGTKNGIDGGLNWYIEIRNGIISDFGN